MKRKANNLSSENLSKWYVLNLKASLKWKLINFKVRAKVCLWVQWNHLIRQLDWQALLWLQWCKVIAHQKIAGWNLQWFLYKILSAYKVWARRVDWRFRSRTASVDVPSSGRLVLQTSISTPELIKVESCVATISTLKLMFET